MSEKNKLLLADDSITIQKVINLTFADEGIEVTTVGNGAAAIERLSEVAPDLVLADVHMPGLNGYEVCERIRSTPGFENTPVMLLVGSFEPFDESEAKRVGANDFLTKPFQSIKQLVTKVHSLLDDSTVSNESHEHVKEQNDVLGEEIFQETPFSTSDNSEIEENLAHLNEQKFNANDDVIFDDEMIEAIPGEDYHRITNDFEASTLVDDPESEWKVVEEQTSQNNPVEFEHSVSAIELDINSIAADFTDEEGSTIDLAEIPGNQDNPPTDDIIDEQETNIETNEQTVMPNFGAKAETKPSFSQFFDDDDLLGIEDEVRAEIAQHEYEPQYQNEMHSEPVEAITPEIVSSEHVTESQEIATVNKQTGIEKSGEYTALNFPPEVIDAIAQRVVEKLSDKVIEKIAWEIVPDRFDLIVRKTVQDKDRER